MKMGCIFGVLIIMVIPSLFSAENEVVVATITEIEGVVEIQRAHGWERLVPLQPLAVGDTIRVISPGKAVLMYLGGTPELITESNSPYLIKKTNPSKSKGEKAVEKLANLFKEMLVQEPARKVNLAVRGAIDSVKDVRPNKTKILFSDDFIIFQWRGLGPPYDVAIFWDDPRSDGEPIFSTETNVTSVTVPIDKFRPDFSYYWLVVAGLEQGDGRFSLISKEKTQSLLKELSEYLAMIPEDYPLTRAIVQSEFFIEKKLYYDAYQFLEKSLITFPESAALHRLFERLKSD
jgi:hypothetical protein